jgi:hypothetical protein
MEQTGPESSVTGAGKDDTFSGSLHLRPLLLRPLDYKIGTAAVTAPNKREGTAVLPVATKIPL